MSDRDAVRALLGRDPQGDFEVVVRSRDGAPVVIRNAPLLDDGTPMPTRYWLIGTDEQRAVGTLESDGGVRRAEAAVDQDELAAAHDRYAVERDAALPADHQGPRPSGGVGGTRTGVKCLHAHYAWFLAGGDDPVGRWVDRQINALHISINATQLHLGPLRVSAGAAALAAAHFTADPPRPEDLTNAIGQISDSLDDLLRVDPQAMHRDVIIDGQFAAVLAGLELGATPPAELTVDRDAAEDLFRTLATEPRADRRLNPGLDLDILPTGLDADRYLDAIVGACCIVVSVIRGLHQSSIVLRSDRP